MRHPILIAALAVVTIGVGAARADERDEALMAHRQPQSSSERPVAMSHPGIVKVAEMESDGRDDDDDEADDEDDGEDNAGGSSAIFPIPQSGAPATVPAPKNPLLNGNARPSVVVQ